MNDQERQVIDDIFRRLEQVANQPRDPEAERYIAEKVRQQPYAPYAMAQALYVQEQALANLGAEVQHLQAELERQPQPQQQGSFLSSIFGGGPRAPEPPRGPEPGSPWGRPDQQPPMQGQPMQGGYGAPQQAPMQAPMGGPWGGRPGGGGFLQSALGTAAGVAGGMMIANALSHAFTGPGALAGQAAGLFGADHNANNLAGGDAGSLGGITDALYPGGQQNEPDRSGSSDQGDFGGDGGDFGDSGDDGDWT